MYNTIFKKAQKYTRTQSTLLFKRSSFKVLLFSFSTVSTQSQTLLPAIKNSSAHLSKSGLTTQSKLPTPFFSSFFNATQSNILDLSVKRPQAPAKRRNQNLTHTDEWMIIWSDKNTWTTLKLCVNGLMMKSSLPAEEGNLKQACLQLQKPSQGLFSNVSLSFPRWAFLLRTWTMWEAPRQKEFVLYPTAVSVVRYVSEVGFCCTVVAQGSPGTVNIIS